MSGINSPQRGAIVTALRGESPSHIFPKPTRLGDNEVFPWGISRDNNGKGEVSLDVLILGLEPRPEVDFSKLPICGFAVLLRTPSEQESKGWSCRGSLVAVELLSPIPSNNASFEFGTTGKVVVYAQQV